jgi:flagellar biosynthesis GTPase FlhF
MADLAKVKRNVGRMVDQDAPEEDIDAYLEAEGVTAEQLRGEVSATASDYGGGPVTGVERFVRRVADPLTFGFNDKAAALTDAVRNEVIPFGDSELEGKDFGEVYDARLGLHRRRTATAHESPEDALQGASDVASSTIGLGSTIAADPVAVAAQVPRGLAAIRSAYEGAAPAAQAGAEALRSGSELIRHGFTYGALGGYGHSDDGGLETVGDMARTGMEGVTFVLGLANLARSLGAGAEWIGNKRAPKIEERSARANEMREVAGETFGPAVSGTGTAERSARGLGQSAVGRPLRDQAGRVISGVEERAQRTLNEQTGGRSSDELGGEVQDFLRHQLTERSVPAAEVQRMQPEQLQDITGLPLPESYAPAAPRVPPVQPRPVDPVTPEAYLDQVRRGVPEAPRRNVEPRYPETPRMEDLPVARQIEDRVRKVDGRIADLVKRRDHHRKAIERGDTAAQNDLAQHGLSIEYGYAGPDHFLVTDAQGRQFESGRREHYQSDEAFDAAQRAATWLRERRDRVSRNQRIESDIEKNQRTREEALTGRREAVETAHTETVQRQRSEAERIADEEARATQALETQRAREEAAQRETPAAVQRAAEETRSRQEQAAREAGDETRRLQAESDAAHQAELAERRTRPDTSRLGGSRETYVTEADAAYEMGRRHTPLVQRNPLGHRGGAPTSTARLLDSIAQEARGGGLLPGYRNGQLFDERGAIRPDLLDFLRDKLGADVTQRLAYLSERRAAPGRQFAPAIQGLHDMRTAIGQAREAAGREGHDAGMLKRLYDAFDQDIVAFRNTGPGGETATRLRQAQDADYKAMLADLKRPLERLFAENTTPQQALGKLATAARAGDLGVLRAFMRVMIDKGDPARGAAIIVSHMADGARSMSSFLKGLGEIKPESRDVLFYGREGNALRRELERLERVAKQMEPYEKMAKAKGGLDLSTLISSRARLADLLTAAGLYFHFWPTMMAVAGSAGVARFMASPRYVRWLTELPNATRRGPKSPEALRHLAALAGIARQDKEGGEEIITAATQLFLPSEALARSAEDELRMLDGDTPRDAEEAEFPEGWEDMEPGEELPVPEEEGDPAFEQQRRGRVNGR